MDEAELKCSNVPYAHDEVAVSPGSLSTQLTNSPAKNIAVAVDAQRDRCLKKYTEKGPALVSRQTVFNSKPIEFKFEGEWLNGSRSGTGKLTTNLPSEYDGEWNKGRRHGRGMQVYPTGNVYKGQWQNDMKSGFGMMKWIDQQQVYEGEWQFDKPDGVGTQVWFRHSCPGFDLRSVESLADCQRQVTLCNRYKGEFKNGQRHGQGKFLYSNGAVYSGCWAHNLKHGPGIFIHINGQVQKGIWNNDIFDEEGHSSRNTCSDQPKLMLDYHVECDDLFPTKHAGSSLPESELISTVLLRNNDHLRRIVAFYESCEDVMVPRMKLCNLWTLIRDCNLRSASLTRAQLRSMFTSYNMETLHPHDGYRVILFRELHEILVRISATILCNQAADHVSDALKVLVQNIIIPRFEICVKAIENNQCRKSLEVLECLAPFEETLRSLFKRLQARQTFTVPSRTLFQCLLKNGVTSKDILQSFNDAYRCDLTDDNDLVVKALDLASDEVLFEEFIEIIGRSFKSLSTSSSNEADISNWIGALQDFQI